MSGPVLVAKEYWKKLAMAEVFEGCDLSKKEVALTKVELFGSVIAPTCLRAVTHRQVSENATVNWVKRTALCDIPGNERVALKRDGLYRVTDKLLEEFLREKEKGLFRLEEKIYLYDLTSSYFEGEAAGNGKARYGYSRV